MSPEREPIRLLVVDDDDAYRTRLCRAFRDRGLAVEGAASLAEAKLRMASFRPQRAVLDLRLGDGSGIDLLGELLALDPEVACVVLTGYGSIATAVEAVPLSSLFGRIVLGAGLLAAGLRGLRRSGAVRAH